MIINNSHEHINPSDGSINLPYLQDWSSDNNLDILLIFTISSFSTQTPVYAKPPDYDNSIVFTRPKPTASHLGQGDKVVLKLSKPALLEEVSVKYRERLRRRMEETAGQCSNLNLNAFRSGLKYSY